MKKGEGRMMKDIEWLVQMINAERETLRQRIETGRGTPNENIFNEGRDRAFAYVLRMIQHLDKPEVLSQEWIEGNTSPVDDEGRLYIWKRDLENLLVPKQEELETKIQELIESYKQEEDAYSNPENGWISGFIEDLKNLVEKEQKYNVQFKVRSSFGTVGVFLYKQGGEVLAGDNFKAYYPKEDKFRLTEQEIKNCDERFWSFAEPVE